MVASSMLASARQLDVGLPCVCQFALHDCMRACTGDLDSRVRVVWHGLACWRLQSSLRLPEGGALRRTDHAAQLLGVVADLPRHRCCPNPNPTPQTPAPGTNMLSPSHSYQSQPKPEAKQGW